jgi:stage IV sporulation protein FB
MKNTFKLFDFMGTPVYLKYWFFILLPLFMLQSGGFTEQGFLIGLDYFLSIFVAVLVHELAHTAVAKKLNHYVEHVYLDVFNGAAAIDTTYSPYNQTILIVAAGPLSNLVLWFIGSYLGLDIFAQVNMFLFIFNILPIYPMDGGRICKAICQWITKPSIGRKINGYISIICSSLLFIFSIMTVNIIMALFAVFFIFLSYKEIEQKY